MSTTTPQGHPTTPGFSAYTRGSDNKYPALGPIDPTDRGIIADVRRSLAVDYAGAHNALKANPAMVMHTQLTDVERHHRVVGMMLALVHIDEKLSIVQPFTTSTITPAALARVEKRAAKQIAAAQTRAEESEEALAALRREHARQTAVSRSAAHRDTEAHQARVAAQQRELDAALADGMRLREERDMAQTQVRQLREELAAVSAEVVMLQADNAARQEPYPAVDTAGQSTPCAPAPSEPGFFWTVDGVEVGTRFADRYGRIMTRPTADRITLTTDIDTSRSYDTPPPGGPQAPGTACGPFFPIPQ